MTIEHVSIGDPNIHEPKGISSAAGNTVYVANGAGTGVWRQLTFSELDAVQAYGSMVISNNAANFPLTAVADTSFATPAQYTLLTGAGAPFASETLFGVTFNTDRLIAPYTGVYKLDAYMNISSFPGTTAKVAMRHLRNGTTYSARPVIVKSAGSGSALQLTGFGLTTLNAGDTMQIVVASDVTGNLVIRDMNVLLTLQRRTA